MKAPLFLALVITSFGQLVAEPNGVVKFPAVTPTVGELKQDSSTGVSFHTSNSQLQHLFDIAEAKEAGNIHPFTPTMKILVEGGGYENAWIETQAMGGEMYAKRNVEVALNNQLIFINCQRADGRMPGVVASGQPPRPAYKTLQGYCFPDPAWKMYFWGGKDRDYLQKLYGALKAYDDYLWRTRDSNGDGLLESYCLTDTGEDGSSRLLTRGAPFHWPFDFPPGDSRAPSPLDSIVFHQFWRVPKNVPPHPLDEILVPFASMDLMAYSYDGRATLAKIAHELGNGREDFWKQQAEDVRQRLIKGLWLPERHACFDHDRNGKTMPELIHNNLRAMYHGMFTQEMADAFVRYHLLNPAEFWTPMPLTSIAINDPLYRAGANDWSGQPQGLTYQRAIRALNNYGHFAEVTLLGRKLIAALNKGGRFPQQFDPYTGVADNEHGDGYGPTLLSMMEYCSLMNGISLDVEHDQVWWSGLADGGEDFTYTQRWNDQTWTLTQKGGTFTARVNHRDVFSCTAGVRVVTKRDGTVQEVVGIDPAQKQVTLRAGNREYKLTVTANQVYGLDGKLRRASPFDYPYHER
ncbi:MAG: hypothetical protein ACFUZC_15450 [Chthoniobacteraceae bacterium]